ncbi:YybS family protein [Salibacterium aidingense]|uniref:YybS family protein n=1 Tax=Salibacterium aidingense TaxID=384933 RepID=UPI00040F4F37|nr:YybS family protein [Salibacterium aidingense]
MQQTRRLTEGAVLSGIFVVMLLLSVFVPFLSIVLFWFMPMPFIIFVLRHGWKSGMVMAVVSLLLSFFTAAVGLPFAIFAAAGGITAGELMRRKKEALFVLAGSSIAYIGGLVLLYAGSVLLLDIDPLAAMQDLMRQSTQQAESMIASLGQDPSENLEVWESMIDQIGQLGPLLIAFTGIMFALITQLIAHAVLRRLQMSVEPFPPLRQWNFPRSLLWYYLIVSIVYWIGVDEGTALETVTWNLFPLLETAMALQGFTVVFHYCYIKSVPKVIPVLLMIFGLVSPFVLLLARILGIIDLGFQLKKRLESDAK